MVVVINELHRNFSSNQLSGTIPSSIGSLGNLQVVYVNYSGMKYLDHRQQRHIINLQLL